jgi:nicotinamidase-related amidase
VAGVRLDPGSTAVLTIEVQRGVCGDLARFPALRDAFESSGTHVALVRLLVGARAAGARVVHCTFSLRADRAGSTLELPLMSAARRDPDYLLQGSDATALLDGLGPEPSDLVIERHHGVSPFTGTPLDEQLCSRGIATVVVCGVSLNVGVIGCAIEAANLGYRVIVASDATVGVPLDYGQAMLANSLPAIARTMTVDEIVAAFSSPG